MTRGPFYFLGLVIGWITHSDQNSSTFGGVTWDEQEQKATVAMTAMQGNGNSFLPILLCLAR
mgnify:CR=1 FL=1